MIQVTQITTIANMLLIVDFEREDGVRSSERRQWTEERQGQKAEPGGEKETKAARLYKTTKSVERLLRDRYPLVS